MTDKNKKVVDTAIPTEDILAELKKIEKIRKARLLSGALNELKTKAKQILILKRETNALLKEIGLNPIDAKKVIDYVNSTIVLTPSDKSKARESSRKIKESMDKEIEKKISEIPILPDPYDKSKEYIQKLNDWKNNGMTYSGGTGDFNTIPAPYICTYKSSGGASLTTGSTNAVNMVGSTGNNANYSATNCSDEVVVTLGKYQLKM